MKINPLVQLEALLVRGTVNIQRTGFPNEYEVTLFVLRNHMHYGGATLAEAINRAWNDEER